MNLEMITSPCCRGPQSTNKMKLKTKAIFSQLKCSNCGEVTTTALWTCPCDIPWYKCSMHVQMNSKHATSNGARVHRKRKTCDRGVDEPMPQVRRIGNAVGDITAESTEIKLIPLQVGVCPKLASRFPNLTRGGGTVTTLCKGDSPERRG